MLQLTVNILGTVTVAICAVLLLRAYSSVHKRLLLWTGLCFLGLTVSNALLIGNFNDEFGFINAFDADTGEFIGTMLNSDGDPLIIPYLWALLFGNGVLSDADGLYFAAGIGDELHGLFGAIDVGASAVSEPGTAALMLLALAGMVGLRGRRGLEPGRAGFVAG